MGHNQVNIYYIAQLYTKVTQPSMKVKL